jgi:hypothetical protein
MLTRTARSLLGRNHQKINKKQQNFYYRGTRLAPSNRLGAGKVSIVEPEEVMMIEETWMQPYLAYMINKTLPEDTVEAKRIIRRSKAFIMLQGKLYKKSMSGVLQRCITPQEGQEILKDIHAGVCGHHASSRAIAAKAFRAGFY